MEHLLFFVLFIVFVYIAIFLSHFEGTLVLKRLNIVNSLYVHVFTAAYYIL